MERFGISAGGWMQPHVLPVSFLTVTGLKPWALTLRDDGVKESTAFARVAWKVITRHNAAANQVVPDMIMSNNSIGERKICVVDFWLSVLHFVFFPWCTTPRVSIYTPKTQLILVSLVSECDRQMAFATLSSSNAQDIQISLYCWNFSCTDNLCNKLFMWHKDVQSSMNLKAWFFLFSWGKYTNLDRGFRSAETFSVQTKLTIQGITFSCDM